MCEDILKQTRVLIEAGDFVSAQRLVDRALDDDPNDWNAHYLGGQCCRFLGDFDAAERYLSKASQLNPHETSIFIALGIALQQNRKYDEAVAALRRSIELDGSNDNAYNSLGLTYKRMGKMELSLNAFDAGLKALSRKVAEGMHNDPKNPILKHAATRGTYWAEYAMFGALYLSAKDDYVKEIAWPTGEAAEREEATERHKGLYWEDIRQPSARLTRVFLPNYFNTFRERLKSDTRYSNLLGNMSTVLRTIGKPEDAQKHENEAREFKPLQQSGAG